MIVATESCVYHSLRHLVLRTIIYIFVGKSWGCFTHEAPVYIDTINSTCIHDAVVTVVVSCPKRAGLLMYRG